MIIQQGCSHVVVTKLKSDQTINIGCLKASHQIFKRSSEDLQLFGCNRNSRAQSISLV